VQFTGGLLTLTLPKTEEVKPKLAVPARIGGAANDPE